MADEPSDNPFAALAGLKSKLPPGPAPKEAPATEADSAAGTPRRAVVRITRKGRRGKTVTLVEKLDLDAAELARWLKAAKGALGCGGTVEDGALVLQGDSRDRVAAWLTQRGVKKVTVAR